MTISGLQKVITNVRELNGCGQPRTMHQNITFYPAPSRKLPHWILGCFLTSMILYRPSLCMRGFVLHALYGFADNPLHRTPFLFKGYLLFGLDGPFATESVLEALEHHHSL